LLDRNWENQQREIYKAIIDLETRIVRENDNVLSAETLYDKGYDQGGLFGYYYRLRMLITFKNNQWVVLEEVEEDQADIIIDTINGYRLHCYVRKLDESDAVPYLVTADVAITVTGRKLNINEIIENFDKMAAYVDSLEEITGAIPGASSEWHGISEAKLRKKMKGNSFEKKYFKSLQYNSIDLPAYIYLSWKESWERKLQQDGN
jgi:hypothetical protein